MKMSNLIKHEGTQYFSVSDYKPIITYAGDKELFHSLESILSQALPQEPTEWRRSFGRVVRAVTLSAKFVPFNESILQKNDHYRLLEQPILHIFWTQCADVDTYKNGLHDEIKDWLQILHHHKIIDWLIVLVETYDFRKHNKLLPRTTVLDKIKSDFGAKHIDRCLSVINPLKSEFRTRSSWRALVVNIRLLILTAYDNALLKLEEYIRTQRECRNQSEWNFCNYFLLQEELAFALEMLGMYEEALIQYDELDALFTQFIRNSGLADAPKWLSLFQIPVDNWSGILLTCKVNRTYRDAVRNHCISLLDFRCYLFSRQSAMLLFTCKPWEIAQRTLPFIHNSLNEIRILEIQYPEGAIACWIFTCCLETVLMCQNFNETAQVDACSQYTASLLELATAKLRDLGELCGLMPNSKQSSEQLHTVVSLSCGIGDSLRFPNMNNVSPVDKLKAALSSKEAYCRYYLELSEQTMITYKHKGRIRSARYIGKQLADFYLHLGDLSKATGLLVNVLSSYEEDNWPILTNEIRLQLLQCYKQMNEIEKLLQTSISVTCSAKFSSTMQMFYFNEVMKILQDHNSEWIVPLEECFSVQSVDVEVHQIGLKVQALIEIVNKFPADIICSNISMSVSEKPGELDFENLPLEKSIEFNIPTELPLVYVLDYQQDKSLAGTKIICENSDLYLRRQSSRKMKKPVLLKKVNFTKGLTAENLSLKPGSNRIVLLSKGEETSGDYYLDQLSISICNKLYFLTCSNHFSQVRYRIRRILPKISIETADNSFLIAGIISSVNLCINMGTYILNEDTVLKLRMSEGFTVSLINPQNLTNEVEINLCCKSEQNYDTYSIPLLVCSEFASSADSSVIDRKIWLKCPWSESEICLIVQFRVPFIVFKRIYTAKLRKFVLITVTGSTKESVILSDPQLSVISEQNFSIKSLNPVSAQPFVIYNQLKIKFMWELISDDFSVGKCTLEFTVNYNVFEKKSSYKCELSISDFKTLYMIESTIAPIRGCEFCRVNTMCHLQFIVKRIASTIDHSLMYEVVTDQTMWAVCNMSTGVIILDETDKCSISVDLMPLVCGYLPLPLIKLSKYFPVEGNVGTSPRLEPFHHGQVFNVNKSTQIQVLPSNLSD